MSAELVFGLKNARLTHISDVESGLNCGCLCPACGRRLVAKKGQIKKHHFAHEDRSECALAVESSLHLAAKDIINREKRLRLPAFSYGFGVGFETCVVEFDEVKVEANLGDIMSDIFAYKNGRPLMVEIKVSHAVDGEKLIKIKEHGISAIEIDLSEINTNDMDTLTYGVIDDPENRKWLFNRLESQYRAQVEAIKQQTRLKAWYMFEEGWYAWQCPIHPRPCCNDCPSFLGYDQNNQAGEDYRHNPDYIYCRGKSRDFKG